MTIKANIKTIKLILTEDQTKSLLPLFEQLYKSDYSTMQQEEYLRSLILQMKSKIK